MPFVWAAALRYNTPIRSFEAIIARILCVLTLAFIGDFGFPKCTAIQYDAIRAFPFFADLPELDLKRSGTEIGPDVIHFGLTAPFPSKKEDVRLSISLSAGRISRIVDVIDKDVAAESISRAIRQRLIGKLKFPLSAICKIYARATAQPLYRKNPPSPFPRPPPHTHTHIPLR